MLYQTHPLLFNPFTSSSNSISSSLQVVELGMESVEGAMKGSLRPELGLKVSQNYVHFQQASSEDLFGGNGQQAEDFSVDDLLDFSNDLEQPLYEEEQKAEPEPEKLQQQNNVSSTQNYDKPSNNSSLIDDFAPLSVPVDDLESLEWLSHFVEDSFCEYSLTCPPGKPAPVVKKEHIRSEPGAGPEVAVNESTVFTTPVQTKARTKRSRSGLRVWSLGAASFTEHSSSSSTSSTSASENGNYSPWGVCQSQTGELAEPAGLKRKRMTGSGLGGTPQPRRCSHCGVQKTPQWRAGPLGAKTLCNACGVRFKSGRLFPEYRPACSPTFSSELHSNNHRKVLEMRRKKDGETELALPG